MQACKKPKHKKVYTLPTDCSVVTVEASVTSADTGSLASWGPAQAPAPAYPASKNVCKGQNIKTFTVTLENKAGHPNQHRIIGSKGFAIDGKKGCILHLRRGRCYYFNIKQKPNANGTYDHLFYITRDVQGGGRCGTAANPNWSPARLAGTPPPTANGTFCINVDEKFPKYSYYQDANNCMLGGMIMVHEKNEK